MKPLAVTVLQNDAGTDISVNLSRIECLLHRCRGSDLIVLPEVFAIRGGHDHYRTAAECLDGPTVRLMVYVAKKFHAWLLAGTIIERWGRQRFNTSVLLDRHGRIRAVYRKIHLFEARLDHGRVVRERADYSAGSRPVMATIEGWKAGLAICYDLRFPELFRFYAANGAHLLIAPSNFTARTGRDHWETLIKARAVENQCFVIAPNQCGTNRITGVSSYGHSCVVGPWGETLAMAGNKPCTISAVLDPARLREIRSRIPALRHIRSDLFPCFRRKDPRLT